MNLLSNIKNQLINIPGWHTKRKIVVIESDDWGAVRMPSKKVYDKLSTKGLDLGQSVHNKYDSIATKEDLDALFSTLKGFKDINGNHPKFTANTIVTNPDFERISQNNFKEYFYESFVETLNKYSDQNSIFTTWLEGINESLFYPQFHGREHLNPELWLKFLQEGDAELITAFNYGYYGYNSKKLDTLGINILSTLDFLKQEEIEDQKIRLKDGLKIFKNTFGYDSKSFIAPRYIWSSKLESFLKNNGIDYMQGTKIQLVPTIQKGKKRLKKRVHYIGQKNKYGQLYLTRNCFFEPSLNPEFDWNSDVINRMKIIFHWGKPAIICSHRLNYISKIDESNRNANLKKLRKLLMTIKNIWPEVEFMSTVELGDLIQSSK